MKTCQIRAGRSVRSLLRNFCRHLQRRLLVFVRPFLEDVMRTVHHMTTIFVECLGSGNYVAPISTNSIGIPIHANAVASVNT